MPPPATGILESNYTLHVVYDTLYTVHHSMVQGKRHAAELLLPAEQGNDTRRPIALRVRRDIPGRRVLLRRASCSNRDQGSISTVHGTTYNHRDDHPARSFDRSSYLCRTRNKTI